MALEILARAISKENEIKGIQIEEKEVNCHYLQVLSYYTFFKNPKDSIKKLLDLIIKFSKVAGYKINTQNFVAFLYANIKLSVREIK